MGRKSRGKSERRAQRISAGTAPAAEPQMSRIAWLEQELERLSDGDCYLGSCEAIPPEMRESHLEDILAFESTQSGPSLFQGLLDQGIELPRPEELDMQQSAEKVIEILEALSQIRVFVVGFQHMDPRQAYATLWHETLWEGCYVQKKTPGAFTMIDASHQLSRADHLRILEDLHKASRVN